MKLKDFFNKIAILFKIKEYNEKDYYINPENINICFFNIPHAVFYVIKKYGWIVFFHKSINYARYIFKKHSKKITILYQQTISSFISEGLRKVTLRIFNYIFYGVGVLDSKEIRRYMRYRSNVKSEIYGIKHIDALNIDSLKEIAFLSKENIEVSIFNGKKLNNFQKYLDGKKFTGTVIK